MRNSNYYEKYAFWLIKMNNKKLRIVHICQASSYTEGMLYQDNILPDVNRDDGHEVIVVADCTCYIGGKLAAIPEEDKILENGVRLVRYEFGLKFLPDIFRKKIRYTPKLKQLLEDFRPDVILYHSLVGASLLTVGAYKRKYLKTRLYLDSHADFNNSAKSFISRWLQYKIFNRLLWCSISSLVEKVFYVSNESRDFLREMYKIELKKMEFYPLGGIIRDEEERLIFRHEVRNEYSLLENDIVFIHAGKFDQMKRTLDVLQSFSRLAYSNFRLLVVGVFDRDISDEARDIIESDCRIKYLGWKTGDDLVRFLCASDCYVQPGSQSATLQTAICCGLPFIVYPHPSHESYLKGNGFYVENSTELMAAMGKFVDPVLVRNMSDASYDVARNMLSYKVLARRLYR